MSADKPNQMNDLLALSYVPRWTIVPHSRPQSVGDHTFRVAVIAMELAVRTASKVTMLQLYGALVHDLEECRTGDIPSPAKPAGAAPPIDEWDRLVRLADLIEALTYIDRWGVGPHAQRVATGVLDKIFDLLDHCPDGWRPIVQRVLYEIRTDAGR